MFFTILLSALIGGVAVMLIQQWLRDEFSGSTTSGATGENRALRLTPVRSEPQHESGPAGGMSPERMRRAG